MERATILICEPDLSVTFRLRELQMILNPLSDQTLERFNMYEKNQCAGW